MKPRYLVILIFVLLASLSCSKNKPAATSIIRVGILGEPSSLDPAQVKDVTGGRIASCIFNCLVRTDLNGALIPDLAKRWEIAPDGFTYRFILHDNVRFHNGKPLTSRDVEQSFVRLLRDSGRAWVLEDIRGSNEITLTGAKTLSGFTVVSDTEFLIHLKKPFAPFLYKLAMPNASIIPVAEADADPAAFSRKPIGSGPWIVTEWLSGQKISLKKNPDYFIAGEPASDKLEFKFYVQDFSLQAEYQNHGLDIIEVTRSLLPVLTADPATVIHTTAGLNVYFLGLNCKKAPFTSPDVRRAMAMAIDRETIMNTLYQGSAVLSSGPIPAGLPGYRAQKPHPGYDPEAAKALLAKNKFDLNREYVLLQTENKEVLGISESIQQYLAAIGVKVRIEQRESSAFKENLFAGNYDLYYYSWWADYPDAENFLYPLFHSANIPAGGNPTFYRNPEVDSLINKAQSTVNRDEASRLYQTIEDRVLADMPRIFLWHKTIVWATRKQVSDFNLYPVFNAEKFERVTVTRE